MGRSTQGGRALRAALVASAVLALAAPAYAQDAVDFDSRFSAFEARSSDTFGDTALYRRDSSIRAEPERVVGNELKWGILRLDTQGMEINCLNGGSAQFPGSNRVRLLVNEATAVAGATFSSNATETRSGESDILVSNRLQWQWARRSRDGLCRSVPDADRPNFDPVRAFTVTAASSGIAYVDDQSDDGSKFAITLGLTQALNRTHTYNDAYLTRLDLRLINAVSYSELYEQWVSTSHDVRAGVSHIFRANDRGRTGVSFTVGHVFSNPERASNDYATVELAHTIANIGRGGWKLKLNTSVNYRNYNEGEPEDFDEVRLAAGATFSRPLADGVLLDIGFNYETRNSDVRNRDFDAGTMPLSITLSRSF